MAMEFSDAEDKLIETGKRLDQLGLAPATSGIYSIKFSDQEIAVTVSGNHKGKLKQGDIMRIDLDGAPMEDQRPSAETLLHCHLYKIYPACKAILHTHSIASSVLTRFFDQNSFLELQGYEMLKVFPDVKTHETSVQIPIFDNSQDMKRLAEQVDSVLKEQNNLNVYLIRGHGLYAWGKTIEQAEYITEAVEMMLQCELETMKLRGALS